MAESEYTPQKLYQHAKTKISEYAKNKQEFTNDNLKLALAFLEQYKKHLEEVNGTLKEEDEKEKNKTVIGRINDTYGKLYGKIKETDTDKFTKFQNPDDFKNKKDEISITYKAEALAKVVRSSGTPMKSTIETIPGTPITDAEQKFTDAKKKVEEAASATSKAEEMLRSAMTANGEDIEKKLGTVKKLSLALQEAANGEVSALQRATEQGDILLRSIEGESEKKTKTQKEVDDLKKIFESAKEKTTLIKSKNEEIQVLTIENYKTFIASDDDGKEIITASDVTLLPLTDLEIKLLQVLEKIPVDQYQDHLFSILWMVKHLSKYNLTDDFVKAKELITNTYFQPHYSSGYGLGNYIYYGQKYTRAIEARRYKFLSINGAQRDRWNTYNIKTEEARLLKYEKLLLKLVDKDPEGTSHSYKEITGENYSEIKDIDVINNMKIVFVLTELEKQPGFNPIKIPYHYLQNIPKETWEKFLFYPNNTNYRNKYSYQGWNGYYNLPESIVSFITTSDDIYVKLDNLYNLLYPSTAAGGKRTPKYLPQYTVGSLPKSLKNKIKPTKKSLKRERDIFNLHRIK
jgi:hypothetical protein